MEPEGTPPHGEAEERDMMSEAELLTGHRKLGEAIRSIEGGGGWSPEDLAFLLLMTSVGISAVADVDEERFLAAAREIRSSFAVAMSGGTPPLLPSRIRDLLAGKAKVIFSGERPS